MGNPYSRILSHPGARAFSASGLIARLPMAMSGLGIILMIEHAYGSYALAGTISAVYVLTMAGAAPVLANLIDKFGQARIMRPALAVFNLGLIGLVLATISRAPTVVLLASAVLAGLGTGSIGSLVRARWSITVRDARELHTAYALESAIDEAVYVIGPVLVTVLATTLSGQVALLFAIGFSLLGGYTFLSLTATEPPVRRRTSRPRQLWEEPVPEVESGTTTPGAATSLPVSSAATSPSAPSTPDRPTAASAPKQPDRFSSGEVPSVPVLRIPAIWSLIAVMTCIGIIFGATDVATVAFSSELGYESMAGVVLGIFAFGSLISGLIYGARVWEATLTARLGVGVIALAIGSSLFLFINSLTLLALVMFATGFAIAPTFVNANAVIQQVVHPSRLTEGLTWMGTANAAGVSIGSALAGVVIDLAGGHAGYWVAIAGAAGATTLILATLPILHKAITPAHL